MFKISFLADLTITSVLDNRTIVWESVVFKSAIKLQPSLIVHIMRFKNTVT